MTAVVPTTPEERLAESLSGRAPDPPSAPASPLSPELAALHARLAKTVFGPFLRQFIEGRVTSLEAERAILEIRRAGAEAAMALLMIDAELLDARLRAAPRRRRRRASQPTPNEAP